MCMFVLELHGKLAAVFFSNFFFVFSFGFWSSELCVTITVRTALILVDYQMQNLVL